MPISMSSVERLAAAAFSAAISPSTSSGHDQLVERGGI
jgi:hypothetical protein